MAADHHSAYVEVILGFHPCERALEAQLFWQAFRGKLGCIMWPEARTLDLTKTNLDPKFSLAARDQDGNLVGLAGFKTAEGALLGTIVDTARNLLLSDVRLHVIDSNPPARAIYEREGFVQISTKGIGILRYLMKFRTSTRMQCTIVD